MTRHRDGSARFDFEGPEEGEPDSEEEPQVEKA
jgi:hypothetical protein